MATISSLHAPLTNGMLFTSLLPLLKIMGGSRKNFTTFTDISIKQEHDSAPNAPSVVQCSRPGSTQLGLMKWQVYPFGIRSK